MAIGVDTSKWKPRRLKGTPAAQFRNNLGFGIVGFGIVSGLIFHFIKRTEKIRKASEGLYEDPIEEVERKLMIASGFANRTGDKIRQLLKEDSRTDLPHNGEPGSCAVTSKYFSAKSAMDDSLSEFRETKKTFAGPKKEVKKNIKPRKAPKRPRGQKDIRTALKSTKNELESYSKDFDKVCKKAGIDVDSEQLQLAIALSKSLQDTASSSKEATEGSQSVTSQDRIGKIRTTLKEYGFKVPEVKISSNTRRIRNVRKNYKLLRTSDIEKQQIIADRYSQVLFQDISHCHLYYSEVDATNIPLYHLASNATYKVLKIQDTLYVSNLIDKSTNTGNLLKDWSKIPGRPESPKLFEPMSMNFSEIECSQNELDIILCGCIKSCRDVIHKKIKDCFNTYKPELITEDNIRTDNHNRKKNRTNRENTLIVESKNNDQVKEPISQNKYRSCSPDMFGDEVSDIFDDQSLTLQEDKNITGIQKTNANIVVMDLTESVCEEKSQSKLELIENTTNRKSTDMELTNIQIQHVDKTTKLSPNSNVTKRRSNDFMELTKCVTSSSQHIKNNIDLTHSPDIIENNANTHIENVEKPVESNPLESKDMDLTNSPDNNDCKNIDISRNVEPEKDIDSMDLTQSSNTSDELPFINFASTKRKSCDETIIIDINDYAEINKRTNSQKEDALIDLTQNVERDNHSSVHSQSIFEYYNYDHSSPELKRSNSDIMMNKKNHNEIDLTQSPDRTCNENNSLQKSGISDRYINKPESIIGDSVKDLKTLSPSKNSSQIIIEPIPVEIHPSNSCFNNLSKVKHTGSPKELSKGDPLSNINLTQKSDTSDINNLSRVSHTESPKELSKSDPLSDIDLTQKSDTSEEISQIPINDHLNDSKEQNGEKVDEFEDPVKDNELPIIRNSQRCSNFGKKDDVSIDYDEIMNPDANAVVLCSKLTDPESNIYENDDENHDIIHFSKHNSFISNCSQNSEVFEISDQELDYSLHKSKLEIPQDNFVFGGISIMNELSDFGTFKKSIDTDNHFYVNKESFPETNTNSNKYQINNEISPIKHRRITEIATPQKACTEVTVITPRNSEMIIKTNNVTPMIDYESMSTPDIHKELDKYGIKPFKRKRAIQLLTHIYNQTHPIIETADETTPPKRRKLNDDLLASTKKLTPRNLLGTPRKCTEITENSYENIEDRKKENFEQKSKEHGIKKWKGKGKGKSSSKNQRNDVSENACKHIENTLSKEIVGEVPISKEIECSPEDWVFQKREKAKVHSCRVPLHIAFYNYVCSRRELREAILCYEPVEIDLIHKDLVNYGHRYDPKDLLKFLDKKCITVKTTDNDGRNNKR